MCRFSCGSLHTVSTCNIAKGVVHTVVVRGTRVLTPHTYTYIMVASRMSVVATYILVPEVHGWALQCCDSLQCGVFCEYLITGLDCSCGGKSGTWDTHRILVGALALKIKVTCNSVTAVVR